MKKIIVCVLLLTFFNNRNGFTQSCGITNIAIGKAVTVTSETSFHPGTAAVDGSTSSTWTPIAADNDTITVDLGQSFTICQVVLTWSSNGRAANFTVQTSTDATFWTDISTITGNSATTNTLSVTGTGRYLRVLLSLRFFNWSSYELAELEIYNSTGSSPSGWSITGNSGTNSGINFIGTLDNSSLRFRTNNVQRMYIDSATGFVGVNTSTAPNAEAKLAVNGAIYAAKLKITQSGWADYVFNKNYKLPSLRQVESYIKLYNHLPGVPSAETIQKEGTDVATTQAMLLKKIEELTLYIIEQNRRIEELENKIKKQK